MRPVIVLMVSLAACGRGPSPSAARSGERIAVINFTNAPNLDARRCAESDLRFPGPAAASWTSVWLQRRGRQAERFASREEAVGADLLVSGQVYAIDGGSAEMRNAKQQWLLWICLPCYFLPGGESTIAIAGEVTRPDGSLSSAASTSDVQRTASSVANAVTNAADYAGKTIAKMVDTESIPAIAWHRLRSGSPHRRRPGRPRAVEDARGPHRAARVTPFARTHLRQRVPAKAGADTPGICEWGGSLRYAHTLRCLLLPETSPKESATAAATAVLAADDGSAVRARRKYALRGSRYSAADAEGQRATRNGANGAGHYPAGRVGRARSLQLPPLLMKGHRHQPPSRVCPSLATRNRYVKKILMRIRASVADSMACRK